MRECTIVLALYVVQEYVLLDPAATLLGRRPTVERFEGVKLAIGGHCFLGQGDSVSLAVLLMPVVIMVVAAAPAGCIDGNTKVSRGCGRRRTES